MDNANLITVCGLVATTPRHIITSDGTPFTTFRLASDEKRFDTETGKWLSAATNWYTIYSEGTIAVNAAPSVMKGDRIIVVGKLVIKDWQNDARTGTSVEIEVTAMGHDLNWGTSVFKREINNQG